MTGESLDVLLAALEGAADGLAGVTKKRMFGCDGLFANGNIFGLVWKHGRIGVRLPNEVAYAEAMRMPESSPWMAGTMAMRHWVLVPPSMHADPPRLAAWVRRAHALAVNLGPKRGAASKPTKAEVASPAATAPRSPEKKATRKTAPEAAAKRAVPSKKSTSRGAPKGARKGRKKPSAPAKQTAKKPAKKKTAPKKRG